MKPGDKMQLNMKHLGLPDYGPWKAEVLELIPFEGFQGDRARVRLEYDGDEVEVPQLALEPRTEAAK
jgi:hypothetical protein